jgi:mannose-6-phosphate isomerase-like protein (cupin superfamily)
LKKRLVFNAKSVTGFSPRGAEQAFLSRMLIDRESVGSQRIVLNYFALRPGHSTAAGSHPAPFDEIYYVLRGAGTLFLHDDHQPFDLSPDTVAFIPAGTLHYLHNTGAADLELITVMPGPLAKGANSLYDERQERWGTSFKLEQ